jgi:hypothetical protein
MDIDKQRMAAVRALEALGYSYQSGHWRPPAGAAPLAQPMTEGADAMHGVLMHRADTVGGCSEGSDEEVELKAIVDPIDAYA